MVDKETAHMFPLPPLISIFGLAPELNLELPVNIEPVPASL